MSDNIETSTIPNNNITANTDSEEDFGEDKDSLDTSDEDFGEKYNLHKSLQYWFGNDIEYDRLFRINRWSKIEEVLIRARMYQNKKDKKIALRLAKSTAITEQS